PHPSPDIFSLSLHDALPISLDRGEPAVHGDPGLAWSRRRPDLGTPEHSPYRDYASPRSERRAEATVHRHPLLTGGALRRAGCDPDRKSTRLNSSHGSISYAV